MTTPKDTNITQQQAERSSGLTLRQSNTRIVGIATCFVKPQSEAAALRNSSIPIGHNESRDNTASFQAHLGTQTVSRSTGLANVQDDILDAVGGITSVENSLFTAAVARHIPIEKLRQSLAVLGSSNALSQAVKTSPEPSRCPCCSTTNLDERIGFYYVNMGQEEARSKLRRCSVGTFLLRDSSQKPAYPYSLTVMTPRGVTSIRIAFDDGIYVLDSDLPGDSKTMTSQSGVKDKSRALRSNCVIDLVERLMSMSPTSSTASDVTVARGGKQK